MAKSEFNIDSLRKDIGSVSFAESRYKNPTYWLDTGCYAVNRIISGNTHNGIPGGRITCLAGESQTCKSMFAARAIKSGQKQGITHVFYLDTEGGALYEYMESEGIDSKRVEHVLIANVEQAISIVAKIFDVIEAYRLKDPTARFIIVFDSIGGLRPKKLVSDALRGDSPIDMGLAARRIGDMITLMTVPALKTDTAVILLNHTYENPGEMMPQKVKSQYGGNKVIYMSRYLLQLSKCLRKSDKLYGASDDDTFYNGSEITVFCAKNASIRPFFEARMLNNFNDPLANRYYGLFDVAVGYGMIVRESSMYKIPDYSGDKKWYAKDIINGEEADAIWDRLIPMIDERSAVDMAFGVTSDAPGLSEDFKKGIPQDSHSDDPDSAHMILPNEN